MKKYMVTLALLAASMHYSQTGIGNGGGNRPIASPAMASMAKYSDMPVSLASGLPEIGIPLLNVPLADKGFQYPLSLSYHPENETVSDVASGWSFFGTGVIYKKIIDQLDECYDMPVWEGHYNNEFDDLYYYNFPGGSGKFRIKRDVVNNTFSLINLTPDHLKIEYTRDNTNLSTFKADGFTITADNGYKYIFNEFDYGKYKCQNYYEDMLLSYKPAYFLTRIISPLGIDVAAIEYEKKNDADGTKYCKLKSITGPNGVVQLNYAYDEALKTTVNDPYSLQGIMLKNLAGEIVYSYEFNYSIAHKPAKVAERKRMLNNVRKNDKNGQKIEQTTFVYSDTGRLSKIISPTGGTTEYIYENNEKFFDFNDPVYLETLEKYGYNPDFQNRISLTNVNINTDQNLVYNFTIPGDPNKQKYIGFYLNLELQYPDTGDNGGGTELPPQTMTFSSTPRPNLRLTIKRGNEIIFKEISLADKAPGITLDTSNKPGDYTIELRSVGGVKGIGNISVSGLVFKPGPYRNAISPVTGSRIKNINFYKNSTDTNPERTINYEYESFDRANSTSGYEFYNEADKFSASSSYIIYSNVKVLETGKGYIKNRFFTANDFPKYQSGGDQLYPVYFWPYYRITKQGLPFKKEIYNEQNTLLVSEETTYDLDYYSNDEYTVNAPGGKFSSKPAYVKKTMNKSTVYYPGGKKMETSSETQFEGISFKPVYSKSAADGDVMEKFMTYPVNLPEYSHLEAAYMVDSPVMVEEKKNGKTMAKAITKFAAPSLLPTSVVSVNSLGESREDMKMEVYDSQGNLVQYRGITGLPVTLIYGYNKSLVIAKIEGVTLAEISSYTADIISASNADHATNNSEPLLVQALETFRKNPVLAGHPITTYTYDPPIGLTSMTSPSGMKEIYEYDSAGRLKTAKKVDLDANGAEVPKKVSEYQYNYKQ